MIQHILFHGFSPEFFADTCGVPRIFEAWQTTVLESTIYISLSVMPFLSHQIFLCNAFYILNKLFHSHIINVGVDLPTRTTKVLARGLHNFSPTRSILHHISSRVKRERQQFCYNFLTHNVATHRKSRRKGGSTTLAFTPSCSILPYIQRDVSLS